jgi:hypothetical protein
VRILATAEPEFGIHGPARQLERLPRLSLVTCPVAPHPTISESEKTLFNQLNRNHRIKYMKVGADTGDEVAKRRDARAAGAGEGKGACRCQNRGSRARQG